MCGRYSFATKENKLKEQIGEIETPNPLILNFNIAPTQNAYVITDDTPGALQSFRWGLIPFWAKDTKIGGRMINARSESILEKPAFRTAAKKRHCLVVADSFYEWKTVNGKKMPYRILLKDEQLLLLAGIWESWESEEEKIHSFTILTCLPNKEMGHIHNRMPVILKEKSEQEYWLEEKNPDLIQAFLKTPKDDILKMYPISPRLNKVSNNGADLHTPIAEQGNLFS